MFYLPNVQPSLPNKLPVPVNRDNMPVLAALKRGTKLFDECGFYCDIPPHVKSPPHIRMSGIGNCARKQWLYLNQHDEMVAEEVILSYETEQLTALNLGNILEEYIVSLLRLGGLEVYDSQKEVHDFHSLITGHIDGILRIDHVNHLLELKALNLNSASTIVLNGLKSGKRVYYAQIQYYMYCLNLASAYFIVLIKDSGQFYIELVSADSEYQNFLRQRVKLIDKATSIEQISEDHIIRDCTFCPGQRFCAPVDGGEKAFIKKFREFHHLD